MSESKIADYRKLEPMFNEAQNILSRIKSAKIDFATYESGDLKLRVVMFGDSGIELNFCSNFAAAAIGKAFVDKIPEIISDALVIGNNELNAALVEAKKEALSFMGDTLTIGDQK